MDTRQVQDALHKIGWPITVDGNLGAQTHQAILDFQRGWTPWALLVDGHAGPQTQHALEASLAYGGACAPGFHFRQFASHGNHWIKVNRVLLAGLVKLVERAGAFDPISGYRDPAYNHSIGGAGNSQHLYGNACDVPPRLSIAAMRNLGVFSGIGYNKSSGLVSHVDVRHDGPNTTGSTPAHPMIWIYAR